MKGVFFFFFDTVPPSGQSSYWPCGNMNVVEVLGGQKHLVSFYYDIFSECPMWGEGTASKYAKSVWDLFRWNVWTDMFVKLTSPGFGSMGILLPTSTWHQENAFIKQGIVRRPRSNYSSWKVVSDT